MFKIITGLLLAAALPMAYSQEGAGMPAYAGSLTIIKANACPCLGNSVELFVHSAVISTLILLVTISAMCASLVGKLPCHALNTV